MEYSQKGLELTMQHEGLRLEAYRDTGGVWTIGYGHTKGIHEGDKISAQQAEMFLKEDVQSAVNDVRHYVRVPLTQGQFDALVDFTFNLGGAALERSTLLRMLNAKNYEAARSEILNWNKDNGKVIEGLIHRRKDEYNMWSSV